MKYAFYIVKLTQYIYKLLFYRLYKWNYDKHGEYDDPAFTAVTFISFFISFNILTILFFFERLFAISFFDFLFPNKLWIIVFGLFIFSINYFMLQYKGRNKKVIAELEKINRNEHKWENLIITVYIISTPILFIIALLCLPVSK